MANKANLKLALAANKLIKYGKAGNVLVVSRRVKKMLFCCEMGPGTDIDFLRAFRHGEPGCNIHSVVMAGNDCQFFHHSTIELAGRWVFQAIFAWGSIKTSYSVQSASCSAVSNGRRNKHCNVNAIVPKYTLPPAAVAGVAAKSVRYMDAIEFDA